MDNENYSQRKDERTPEQFQKNIQMGVHLQFALAEVASRHMSFSSCIRYMGFGGVNVTTDTTINTGSYVDTGDGEILFSQAVPIEFKTKEIDSDMFSFKRLDLERCVRLGKPIIMANRMLSDTDNGLGSFEYKGKQHFISEKMVIRCIDLQEIVNMLDVQVSPLKHMGNKPGWVYNDDDWNDLISIRETRPEVILACYRKCFPHLFSYRYSEQPWEADRRKLAEAIKATGAWDETQGQSTGAAQDITGSGCVAEA